MPGNHTREPGVRAPQMRWEARGERSATFGCREDEALPADGLGKRRGRVQGVGSCSGENPWTGKPPARNLDRPQATTPPMLRPRTAGHLEIPSLAVVKAG